MCLIIAKTRGEAEIPKKYIELAAQNNPDGFGIVGKDRKGDIFLSRTLDMGECLDLIRVYEKEEMDFLAHFRWATHGKVDETNTHPFQLHGLNYIVHNGVVTIPTPNKDLSDTWHLVADMKDAIKMVSKDAVMGYLATRPQIVGGSKFAVIGEDLPLSIFNESAGVWKDGVWYSNAENFEEYKWKSGWSDTKWGKSYSTSSSGQASWEELDMIDRMYDDISYRLLEGSVSIEELATLDVKSLTSLMQEYPEDIAMVIADRDYEFAEESV
jgi:hypothetical protein